MINPVDDVSVELSLFGNVDGNKFERESSKEFDGEHRRSTSSRIANWPKMDEIRNPHDHDHQPKIFIPWWDVIFTVSSAFAVFIDPLICYLPVIVEDSTCYFWDQTLMWSFLALRSALDLFYAMEIVVFLRRSREGKANYATSFGVFWKKLLSRHPHKAIPKWLYGDISLRFFRILPRICAALPLLQLFGALWYNFSMERELVCWQEHVCKHENICDRKTLGFFFYCGRFPTLRNEKVNIPLLQKSCAVDLSENVTTLPFDYGIYLYALQSDLIRTKDLPMKILQCLWWGLRNLSSFGSNLQTSFYKGEIIFSIVISISGLALFLVYLNSRVQGSQKITDHRKLMRKKMQVVYPQIIDKTRLMARLRLASLMKVPMLEGIDKNVLKAICEHLKPMTYGDDIYIIREGEPLRKMLFLTRGSVLTYPTSFGSTGTSSCTCLEKGDFYGEELVSWAFKSASYYELPISTRNVVSQTKVEAFSITANELKSIVAQFWWHFKMDQVPRSQLEHLAASSLQATWRRHHARAKGLTGSLRYNSSYKAN